MEGTKILNYKIEKLIGKGGMGEVYLASNMNIDHKVAIKVLASRLSDHEEVKRRFEIEASLLADMDHPNIVKFLNYVDNEDGVFLIMEYIRGETLDEYIKKKIGPVPEEQTWRLFSQLLDAFEYAHKRDIIHRDIKPSNIIITEDQKVKVLDFGIARIIKESVPGETKVGTKMGTAQYMSPEQVQALDVDSRSDIYALGVVLHQMISGQSPYDDTTMSELEIENRIVKGQLPRTKEFYPYSSDKVQIVIDQAVEKKPEDRFESCGIFKEKLQFAIFGPPPNPDSTRILKVVAMAVFLLLCGAGIWYWDYTRVKVKIYKDYIERWGVFEGIHQLDKQEFRKAEAALKFEYRNYKLHRVSRVNHMGLIHEYANSEDIERPNDARFHYQDDGKVDFVEIIDRNGKVLYIKDYNQKLNVVTFRQDDEFGTELSLAGQTVDLFKNPFTEKDDKGDITRWLLEYDDNGFVTKILYAKIQNELTSDQNGIYGRLHQLDKKGRIVRVTYLDREGDVKETQLGFAGKTYEFDQNDDRVKASWVDKDGNKAKNSYEHSYEIVVYDNYGNPIREEYYSINDEPMINESGVFGWGAEFDENGNEITRFNFDTKNEITNSTGGYAMTKSEFDEFGNETMVIFYDIEGNITYGSGGIAMIERKFDGKGNEIEVWFRNPEGELTYASNGIAGFKEELDSLGNTIKYAVYDIDSNPSLQKDGTHGYVAKYDDKSNVTQYSDIGVNGLPVTGSDNVAITKNEYDQKGNLISINYFDTLGDITLNILGISGIKYEYDDLGHQTSMEFFGMNNTLTIGEIGFAGFTSAYDEKGNKTSLLYFDEDRLPVALENGVAGWSAKYDEFGHQVEHANLDRGGNYAEGYLITKYRYENDQLVGLKLYNRDFKPALNEKDYSGWYASYDERGNLLSKTFTDVDDKAVVTTDGYASVKYDYDAYGNTTKMSFYDQTLNPSNENEYGVPVVKQAYSPTGNLTSQRFYQADGETKALNNENIFEVANQYDPFGRLIQQANYRKDGSLAILDGTEALQRYEYDSHGNLIASSYVDQEGKLQNNEFGYAIEKTIYDERGNIKEESYFNADEKKTVMMLGYHKYQKSFDEKSNVTEVRYLGTSDQLINCLDGYARIVNKYDESGRNIETSYLNKRGKLANSVLEGHARVVLNYNGENLSSKKWFDKNNQLTFSNIYNREGELRYKAIILEPGKTIKQYPNDSYEIEILDGFDSNRSEWKIDNSGLLEFTEGRLHLNNLDDFSATYSYDFIEAENFTIELKLKVNNLKSGSYAGLSWNSGDHDEWGFFVIKNDSLFTQESKWQETSAIKNGYNLLKVVYEDSVITYRLNGVRVYTDRNTRMSLSKPLNFVVNKCSADFDYVKVSTKSN